MRESTSDGAALAERLEQVMRRYQTLAYRNYLRPNQWSALRYFAHAPPEQLRLIDFARARCTTMGTASTTVSGLVRRGLMARGRRERNTGLHVTAEGMAQLANDPMNRMAALIGELPVDERHALGKALARLASGLAEPDLPDGQ